MEYRDDPRVFACWSLRREEKYLEKMAQKGWHLYRVQGRTYRFVKGEEEGLRYAVEYAGKAPDNPERLAMLCNAGWTFVGRGGKKRYYVAPAASGLRHPASYGNTEPEMLQRVRSNLTTLFLLNLPGTAYCLLKTLIIASDRMLLLMLASGMELLAIFGCVLGLGGGAYLLRAIGAIRRRLQYLERCEEGKQ